MKATSYGPVMKYADNRDLRRELYMASTSKCMVGGEYDNRQNLVKIANVRLQIANLLGHKSYADYALVHRMAENKESVDRVASLQRTKQSNERRAECYG